MSHTKTLGFQGTWLTVEDIFLEYSDFKVTLLRFKLHHVK